MTTPDPFDFAPLLDMNTQELLLEIAGVHGELARLHEEIALVRAAEANKDLTRRSQRINDEGHRDALIEKKFLIARLLDIRKNRLGLT